MYAKTISLCYFKRDLFDVHMNCGFFFFKLGWPFKFWKANIWQFISCGLGSKGLYAEASFGLTNFL